MTDADSQALAGRNREYLLNLLSRRGNMEEPALKGLWTALLERNQEAALLRISPHRSVYRLSYEDRDWLFKVYHPRRKAEIWRNRLRIPAALREAANWEKLRLLRDDFAPAVSAQFHPQVGLFARPWLQGSPIDVLSSEADASSRRSLAIELGECLGRFHRNGWGDPDLASDHVWRVAGGDPPWVPVDLGRAEWSSRPTPALAQHRDLLLLLATWPEHQVEECLEPLLEGHYEGGGVHFDAASLGQAVWQARLHNAIQQSKRCFRDNRDFQRIGKGVRRRQQPVTDNTAAESLAQKRRTQVVRRGLKTIKVYRHRSIWRRLRTQLQLGPGRRAYRRLYTLELLDIPAARILGWAHEPAGENLSTRFVDGHELELEELKQLGFWLGRLHRFGMGLRDAKRANFVSTQDHQVVLIDGDGLQWHALRKARDLGRLMAEVPMQALSLEDAVSEEYGRGRGVCGSWKPPPYQRHRRRFQRMIQKRK